MKTRKSLTVEHALSAQNIAFSYGRKAVLTDVCLHADAGECVAIAGLNGSGKSTLLGILAGMRQPDAGAFTCYGHDMFAERGQFARRIGYVPQENPLIPDLSVYDNLRLWSGVPIEDSHPLIEKLQLGGFFKRRAGKLSGGEKRRLAVACALLGGQSVLIMDEPTAALDLEQQQIIQAYIRDFTGRGGVVLIATHDIMEIQMSQRIYYLSDTHMEETDADSVIERLRR